MAGRIKVGVSTDALDLADAHAFVSDPACGGVALFVGVVRCNNLGRDVVAVSYDVFEDLASVVLTEIARETITNIDPAMNVYAMHYKGRLEVGGVSVLIAVSAPHRGEAFRGCRRVIDEIKHRAPVWKCEHYVDGDSGWIEGHALCRHGDDVNDDDAQPHPGAHPGTAITAAPG